MPTKPLNNLSFESSIFLEWISGSNIKSLNTQTNTKIYKQNRHLLSFDKEYSFYVSVKPYMFLLNFYKISILSRHFATKKLLKSNTICKKHTQIKCDLHQINYYILVFNMAYRIIHLVNCFRLIYLLIAKILIPNKNALMSPSTVFMRKRNLFQMWYAHFVMFIWNATVYRLILMPS